nr:MAG TPA: hypothetical protein [Caudoviricetes sp.]
MNRNNFSQKRYHKIFHQIRLSVMIFKQRYHPFADKYVSLAKLSIYLMKKSIYYLTKAEKIVK